MGKEASSGLEEWENKSRGLGMNTNRMFGFKNECY